MPRKQSLSSEKYASRVAVLNSLYDCRSSSQAAATALAAIAHSDEDLEDAMDLTWFVIISSASDMPDHHERLVQMMVCLSQLGPGDTPAMASGIKHRDTRSYFYLFGWQMNDEWNSFDVPTEPGPERVRTITRFININKFTARLIRSGLQKAQGLKLYGLWTIRQALEWPAAEAVVHRRGPPEAFVPAAAAWISIIGPEVYAWEDAWVPGPGTGQPGAGGPLWDGKHGFCPERWAFWRTRFAETAETAGALSEDVRRSARQAKSAMEKIEGTTAASETSTSGQD